MRVPKKHVGIDVQSYCSVEWPQLSAALFRLLTNANHALPADSLYKYVDTHTAYFLGVTERL